MRDIKQDRIINKTNLDGDLVEMPILIEEWGELLNQAKELTAQKKLYLDGLSSQVFVEIKESGSKGTEALIKAKVAIDPRVVEANNQYLTALKYENDLKLASKVIDSKMSGIKELVKLYNSQYWGTDSIDGDYGRN